MLGFEIKINGEVIHASADNVHVIISQYKNSDLYVGGVDKNKGEHLTWYSCNIGDMETITVKVIEVEQISEVKERHSTSKEVYELMEYWNLRKNLEEANII
jgi:hypothetical protein